MTDLLIRTCYYLLYLLCLSCRSVQDLAVLGIGDGVGLLDPVAVKDLTGLEIKFLGGEVTGHLLLHMDDVIGWELHLGKVIEHTE